MILAEEALQRLDCPRENRSPNLHAIVDRISPALEALLNGDARDDAEKLLSMAVRSNIHASVDQLRHGSEILQSLIRHEGLLIIGAEYCLESGEVEFFDD